jgi:hypothetical protein
VSARQARRISIVRFTAQRIRLGNCACLELRRLAPASKKSLKRYTVDRRGPAIAWYSTKTTIPPMNATRMLHRLKPVTP